MTKPKKIEINPKKHATADLDSLKKIFTIPENKNTTLGKIEEKISKDLNGFLAKHIIATENSPINLEKGFLDESIPDDPLFVSDQAEYLMKNVVSQSVHTCSPFYIGHMTAPLPYFMLPLTKIMIALNQNLVKIETSKAFTPLERQVLAMLHNAFYQKGSKFYKKHIQNSDSSLGVMCSGGTIANITSLWVAINTLLKPNKDFNGIMEEGLIRGCLHYGYSELVVLVSKRGHYSLKKSCHLLGIGVKNLIQIDTDENHKMDVNQLILKIKELRSKNIGIIAIVGVAGTTETGHVDPLEKIGTICVEEKIYFHVDGAWGAPAIFSKKNSSLLKGIELADSIVVDAHKQLFIPMGAGIALFKNPESMKVVEHSADYIIRKGSRDLGRRSLEGSRPGMAILIHSGLRVLGRNGYGLLIDTGIEKAKKFSEIISDRHEFELTSVPELNILTYRLVPKSYRNILNGSEKKQIHKTNEKLNQLTISIQKRQRDRGKSFVSRTTLSILKYDNQPIVVFRVILANPLTTLDHFNQILDEQIELGKELKLGFSLFR